MFFLSIPYRPTSFFTIYKALLASSSTGVYFCIRVAAGVTGRAYSVQVLLVVVVVYKVGV